MIFFKQKTADEMRIRDLSSDVCSSDLFMGSAHTALADLSLEAFRMNTRLSITTLFVGALLLCGPSHAQEHYAFGFSPNSGDAWVDARRPEARRVRQECGRTDRSRWAPSD